MSRRARGNIADFPYTVRREINLHIRDGWQDEAVAQWIIDNGHGHAWAEVKNVLRAITVAVFRWRNSNSGHKKWELEQRATDGALDRVNEIERKYAAAAGPGAEEYLRGVGRVHLSLILQAMEKAEENPNDLETLATLHSMLTDFYNGEREKKKIEQKDTDLELKSRRIALIEAKEAVETAATAVKLDAGTKQLMLEAIDRKLVG